MIRNYRSNFREHIVGLLILKQSCGFQYNTTAEYYLSCFDRFCVKHFPEEHQLSRLLVLTWTELHPGETSVSHRRRLSAIRQLTKYMISQGIQGTFVLPDKFGGKIVRRIPHFFTLEEVKSFFRCIDSLPVINTKPGRHLTFPVLFRVLYCCGLRPSEVRLLKCIDADIEKGIFLIRNSKWCKDRFVILSDSLLQLCRKYDLTMKAILPGRMFFFPKDRINPQNTQGLRRVFLDNWKRAELDKNPGTPPHVFDWRHHFALSNLNRWVENGEDFNVKLPYLCRYMGHSKLENTDYYLHFVSSFFPVFKEKTQDTFNELIPEARYEKR